MAVQGQDVAALFAMQPPDSLAAARRRAGIIRPVIEFKTAWIQRTQLVFIRLPEQITFRAPNLKGLGGMDGGGRAIAAHRPVHDITGKLVVSSKILLEGLAADVHGAVIAVRIVQVFEPQS